MIARLATALCLMACSDALPDTRGEPRALWSVDTWVSAKPALVGAAVVFVTRNGRVESRQRSSGGLNWSRELGTIAWGAAISHVGGRVIVPAYQLHALDPATGSTVWRYNGPDGRAGVSAPGVAGDVLYVADQGGIAVALQASDGAVLWTKDVGAALFTPTVHGDLLLYPTRGYVTGARDGPLSEGPIVALDRHSGAELWRYQLPDAPGYSGTGGAVAPGVVVGDRLIFGALNGSVYALRLSDGQPVWTRKDSTAEFFHTYNAAALLFDGSVVVVRSDNRIDALDPENGSLRWSQSASLLATPQSCGRFLCLTSGRMMVLGAGGVVEWAYGGGSTGWITLGEHVVGSDGTVYVGVVRNLNETTFEALRLPITLIPE